MAKDKSPDSDGRDPEGNRLTKRMQRYAKVGAGVGGVAARFAGAKLLGGEGDEKNAIALANALGGLKGPIMKVAQMLATIPEAVPPEYAEQLQQLQSDAPPMGKAFVRRRMRAELGADWREKFDDFTYEPAAAASLGQVHRASLPDGRVVACKLQYPDMLSAVEADLSQLDLIFSLHRRMNPAIDTRDILTEIGARVREELDYHREAAHMQLYRRILADDPHIHVPDLVTPLSTQRLLTMTWCEGQHVLDFKEASLEHRNRIAEAMFRAWWHPFCHFGVIHGDPHFGNYTIRTEEAEPVGINLLDYGCIRIFPPRFVEGVVQLYRGLEQGDEAQVVHAYEAWGFQDLTKDLIEILNIWARFIYGPLLDDRVRTIADGIKPGAYGRKQAFAVHKALKEKGPVRVPREFVFMDRAAIGLGGVFLHLNAELNFYQLLNEQLQSFARATVAERQDEALKAVGLADL